MTFAHPWLLAGLPIVIVALGLWAWGSARQGKRARALSRSVPGGPRYLSAVLLAGAAAAAVLAAAQPRWGTQRSALPREGAELVVVLDVSRSMAARDVAPNRLDAAKDALRTTIGRLGGDRVGLVIFAGDARLRFPLTTDFRAARDVIGNLETGSVIVEAGTSASSGLDIALSAFDPEAKGGKLILLITDGDDLGADPAGVAQRIRDSGVELMVVGAGTAEGATVPVYDARTNGFVDKKDAAGAPIITKLNEPFLRALASAAGGRYLGANLRAVPGAVAGRLATIQHARIEQETATVPIERVHWFAGAALALVVLASLAERLPRRASRLAFAPAVAAFALLIGACASDAHTYNADGVRAYRAGDFATAADLFAKARAAEPDNARIDLNLAAALTQAGRYAEGGIAARRVLGSRDAELRGLAQGVLGHQRFALRDLAGALAAFRQALIENPGDDDARHDYEVVLRLLNPDLPEPGDAGGATPTPGAGETPGANASPSGTPAAGGGDGASGSPTPGGSGSAPSTPRPGGQGANGTPQPGQDANRQQLDQSILELDQRIARLVKEAGDDPSPEEALEILQLLAERTRLAAIREALGGASNPRDY